MSPWTSSRAWKRSILPTFMRTAVRQERRQDDAVAVKDGKVSFTARALKGSKE